MRFIKTTTVYLLLLYSITNAASFRVNMPIPLVTATAHEGEDISDRDTSYFGINVIVTGTNLYSDFNYEFLMPILWSEGKWSELETDKNGEYYTGSIQHLLTEGNRLVNLYIGPSIFGYRFNTDNVTDSYVGMGVSTTITYNKDEDTDIPMTLMLSLSGTTDCNNMFISPKLSFMSYEMFPDLEGVHFNILMSVGINYSREYTYKTAGMALGIVF